MSWILQAEQAAALSALQRERDLALLQAGVAAAFPDAAARLGERFPQFVALGAKCGAAHGFRHLRAIGGYLACWIACGTEFETRPGYEWAASLLAGGMGDEGAQVYQLCCGVRETLTAAAADSGGPKRSDFDAALAALDAGLRDAGDLGDIAHLAEPPIAGRRRRLALGLACDIDAIDLRRVDGAPHQRYLWAQGRWQRQPCALAAQAWTASATTAQVGAPPVRLHLLVPSAASSSARMRLRTRSVHCCELHPWVRLGDSAGARDWRGAAATDIAWSLPASPAADGAAGLQPVMGTEIGGATQRLELASCGLRDQGNTVGDVALAIETYPSDQHLLGWRRDPWALSEWPGEASTPPATRIRIERDGVAVDAARWQAGWDELDRQLGQGLARLASAWEQVSGVSQGRLAAEPRLMCGNAALTWGWDQGPAGALAAPFLRTAGNFDLIACRLDLRFQGTLAMHGAVSRLALHCAAADVLRAQWDGGSGNADPTNDVAAAQSKFQQPFVLVCDVLAQDSSAVLEPVGAVSGMLVGQCGLRARTEGAGLQWFIKLVLEPVSVAMAATDPLLGTQQWQHPLLPATTLLDWSLG